MIPPTSAQETAAGCLTTDLASTNTGGAGGLVMLHPVAEKLTYHDLAMPYCA
jgi:hypothetical protein